MHKSPCWWTNYKSKIHLLEAPKGSKIHLEIMLTKIFQKAKMLSKRNISKRNMIKQYYKMQ